MTDEHTKFFGPPPPGYVFTEIVNVTFPAEPDLENEASPEGQIWTSTLQTYLTHPGTKTVWWGRRVDSPQVVKLIIGSLALQSLLQLASIMVTISSLSRLEDCRGTLEFSLFLCIFLAT